MNEMDYPSSSFLPSSYQEYVHTDLPPEAVNEVFIRTTTLREGAQEAHGLAAEIIVLLVADVLPGFNLVLHHTLAVVGVADGRELVLAVRSFRLGRSPHLLLAERSEASVVGTKMYSLLTG